MSEVAGYSNRPLQEKLGIHPSAKVLFLNAPDNYRTLLGDLPPGIRVVEKLESGLDFIHFFTKSRAELEERFPELKQALDFNGMLWVSWPKRASKVGTDLNDNIVREIGLAGGLVDVKVSAIDQIWSGLKFVYRLQDRPKR